MHKRFVVAISMCLFLALSASVANAVESIIREAESANSITAPFVIQDDAAASGGKYIVNPSGSNNSNPPTTGIAKYNITVTEGGTYKLFLRVLCTVGGDGDDSCFVRINGATPSIVTSSGWTNSNNIDRSMAAADTQVWFWAQIHEYDNQTWPGTLITFDIPKGSTTIEIAYREDGLKIDQLILTNDPAASTTNLPLTISSKPYPADKATDVSLDTQVWWKPGVFAETFNVFIGTDYNDVLNATAGAHDDVVLFQALDVNNLKPGMLEYGKNYYWRVDDIGTATNKGGVWKFTSEPEGRVLASNSIIGVEFNSPIEVYSYQDPNSTYNGKGLDDVNGTHSNENTETNSTMWVGMGDAPGDVWLKYELDQVYKLYQLQIWNYNEPEPSLPFGAKDVNILYSIDNVTWKALDEIQVFPMGTGESTYKADIFVNMNGAIAKYVKLSFLSSHTEGMYTGGISEIRFFVIPTRVTVPSPANNATNVDVGSILSWKAGRGVAVHKIYIDSDKNAVIDGTAAIKGETEDSSYSMVLGLGKTYYWKVDEVNDAEEYTTWDGPVWKFSTPQFILVDGFEIGYGNDPGKDAVFLTWKDGAELGDSSNGSYMGRKSEPYLQTINHSGGHSTQMTYDNQSYSYSEVKAQSEKLPIGTTDWSIGSPKTLTIWFRGDPNTTEISDSELYCKIGGKTATYSGSLDILMKDLWWQWDIDLAALGANLTNIPDITIGIKRVGTVGSQGVIYLDDIMLTGIQAVTSSPDLYIEAENYVTITAPMDVNNVLSGAFGGTYVGVTNGKSSSTTEPKYPEGTVTYNVTVDSGVYKIMARIYIQGNEYEGDSCWVKIPTATAVKTADGNDVTLTPAGSTIADGWVNSNNLVGGTSWQWDTFLSSLNSDQDALFTLTAGTHTILISNREDGLWIDALLLVKVGD